MICRGAGAGEAIGSGVNTVLYPAQERQNFGVPEGRCEIDGATVAQASLR